MREIIIVLVAVLILSVPAFGQHEEDHQGHKHHVAMFLGNTHNYHGEDAFTVGLDYEFRLHSLLGIGALIDHATEDIDSTVAGVGLFGHPWRDLRVLVAAANEHHHGENEFVVRVGAMYDFSLAGWSIAPTVNVDLLEDGEENWIYGFAFGRGL